MLPQNEWMFIKNTVAQCLRTNCHEIAFLIIWLRFFETAGTLFTKQIDVYGM